MPLGEQQKSRWDGSQPEAVAREIPRGIWLADRRSEQQEFWLWLWRRIGAAPAPGPHSFLPGFTGAAATGGRELCGQLPAGGPRPAGSWECPAALPPAGEA